jgi:FSR family fosmidomycin resistance protein-like MFS transporter
VAGLCVGIVAPSRDMLIRSITPPGDVGKVFGFVSSGFHLGGTVGPVTFGYLLDTGEPRSVFWAVGGLWLVTIATVMITGHVGRTRTQ